MLDFTGLKGLIPDTVYANLLPILTKYKINTVLRLSHFISQCSHESSNFHAVEENFNYSKEGLLKIFPKYFNEEKAQLYARNPKAIANLVYANRMGNGPESTGDGWRYRGRGYIQLTGKNNYINFNSACSQDVISFPELVASVYALEVSGWYWQTHKLNELADKGISAEVVTKITKIINGGINGLSSRVLLANKYYNILK